MIMRNNNLTASLCASTRSLDKELLLGLLLLLWK